MNVGKRYQLRIHPAGIATGIAALLFYPSYLVFAALIALALHEMGHMAALFLIGIRSWRFELTPFGGMADIQEFDALRPLQQMLCAAAGLGVSAVGLWICIIYAPDTPFWAALIRWQFSLMLINCLPAWPLDGARILVALASCLGWENSVRRLLSHAAQLLGIVLTGIAMWGAWRGIYNPSLLIAGPYLCYAASLGNVADRLRQIGKLEKTKLGNGHLYPLSAFVCAKANLDVLLPRMIGQFSRGRYQMLIAIDKEGKVAEILSEDQMIRRVFEDGKD